MKWVAGCAIGAAAMGFTAPTEAQSTWLCVVDKTAGFAYKPELHTWMGGVFTSENKKYIVREPSAEEKKSGMTAKYVMLNFGIKYPSSFCSEDFNAVGVIQCAGMEILYFNKTNLRFQVTYEAGYVTPFGNEGSDTPFIEIGLCSEI